MLHIHVLLKPLSGRLSKITRRRQPQPSITYVAAERLAVTMHFKLLAAPKQFWKEPGSQDSQ